MSKTPGVFPLRLRDERLRALLREVALQEHISQNELIEQAIQHELALRGARLADDLAAASRRLAALSEPAYEDLVTHSIEGFVTGEAQPEPLQARALHGPAYSAETAEDDRDPLGVLAAFRAGHR